MKKQPTIRDVAKVAGVSPATVSRALSQPVRVKLETVRRVRETAEKIGYRTRLLETDTEQKLTETIVMTASDLRYPIYGDFIQGMTKQCRKRGFCLMTVSTDEDLAEEQQNIKRILPHTDGMVLTSTRLPDSMLRKAAQVKPLIIVNRIVRGVQSVLCDDRQSLNEAVMTLYNLGHRSLTYIEGPEKSWQNGLRRQIIFTACRQLHIDTRQIPGPMSLDKHAIQQCFTDFLKRPTTAVIAYNDGIASTFINFLQERGIMIPEQVSVIGIDDASEAQIMSPSLSSIALPRGKMGNLAATQLINRILHVSRNDSSAIFVKSHFVPRDSIAVAYDAHISFIIDDKHPRQEKAGR